MSNLRDFPPGRSEFFRKNGLRIVIACLTSGVTKLTIKSLFLISYLYTAGSESMTLWSLGHIPMYNVASFTMMKNIILSLSLSLSLSLGVLLEVVDVLIAQVIWNNMKMLICWHNSINITAFHPHAKYLL